MEHIEVADLEVLRAYLNEISSLSSDYQDIGHFEDKWTNRLDKVYTVVIQLTRYSEMMDRETAVRVRHKLTRSREDKYMVYKEFILFLQKSISNYYQDLAATLLQTSLLTKPIQEMTGFEFKTILLATLTEFSDRQKS